MNIIPLFLRRRIAHRPNLVRILDNIGWLFFDKALRMGLGLFVGVWVARYLGPEQYGQLNYAMAFVALFGAIATMGLNDVVVRDLIKEPEDAPTILGTALLLQIVGALIAVFLMFILITLLRPEDRFTRMMVMILGFSLVFQASGVISYWYEAMILSRYAVWIGNTAFLIIASTKIILIKVHASLLAFAWVVQAEAILVTIGLLFIYAKQNYTLPLWRVNILRAKKLLLDSWPLILSGIAIMIYMRIDQIMLGEMIGQEAVGLYSAALRISEVWYMIPMVVTASLFPAIIESKKKSSDLYHQRLQNLLSFLAFIAILIGIIFYFIGGLIVNFLYGLEYSGASNILKIHIWAGLFVFIGGGGSKWYLIENLQILHLYRTVYGAVINIILNYYLIPRYNTVGAAIATVISYAFSAYLLDWSSSKSIALFRFKTRAIFMNPFKIIR